MCMFFVYDYNLFSPSGFSDIFSISIVTVVVTRTVILHLPKPSPIP